MVRLLLILLLIAPTFGWARESAPVETKRSVATLVSDTDSVAPGVPFRVALRLRMAEG